MFFKQKFIITGKDRLKLLNKLIKNDIQCEEIVEKNESVIFITSHYYVKDILSLCDAFDCKAEVIGGIKRKAVFKKVIYHSGLVFGLMLALGLSFLLDKMVLKIDIQTDDIDAKRSIMSVLNENGIHIGSFYKDHDMIKLERELKSKVDEISWAGISVQGSTMVIDTLPFIPAPESDTRRLPCDVVALYDCVIEKAEVYCGELKVCIGSGVRAGDILISGKSEKVLFQGDKEKEQTITAYDRANGKIYGTFEKKYEMFFPYEEYKNTLTGKSEKVSYLNVFDADIPLFINGPKGSYTYTYEKEPLIVLGFELPIAKTDVTYNEYVSALNTFTDEEIDDQISSWQQRIEQSFINDFEIKDSDLTLKKTDKGTYALLTYKLYGEAGRQADIYVKKS